MDPHAFFLGILDKASPPLSDWKKAALQGQFTAALKSGDVKSVAAVMFEVGDLGVDMNSVAKLALRELMAGSDGGTWTYTAMRKALHQAASAQNAEQEILALAQLSQMVRLRLGEIERGPWEAPGRAPAEKPAHAWPEPGDDYQAGTGSPSEGPVSIDVGDATLTVEYFSDDEGKH